MKFLLKASLWLFAFIPLVVDTSVFFPYIYGKTVFIRFAIFLTSVIFFGHFIARPIFRQEVTKRVRLAFKNPLVISLCVFMLIVLISTIFAVNPYRAFFGDVERGEGFLGLLSFFAFFVYSYLSFEKKDWLWFFRLNILTGAILFIKELYEFTHGFSRPGAYTGNPEFLAGYFLFVIFASILVFANSRKSDLWRYVAPLAAVMGVVGIFITQTRGTILGLMGGLLALVVYGFIYGKHRRISGFSVRQISVAILVLAVAFIAFFFATKENTMWRNIPGLGRISQTRLNDASFGPRLVSWTSSIKSVEPKAGNMERFFIGYGPDNFYYAYNKNYNPQHYFYEKTWFDRAHNKLIDMVVMHGVFGLLAYLAVWASFTYLIFKSKKFSVELMTLFLFGASYFTHLLTVFDQISTYIPFFGMMAFLVFILVNTNSETEKAYELKKTGTVKSHHDSLMIVVFACLAIWFTIVLVFWAVIPYFQMANYLNVIKTGDVNLISQKIDSVFEPYTFVQQDIRYHFMTLMISNYGKVPQINVLFDKAVQKMEELVEREPSNPRYMYVLGQAYDAKYRVTLENEDIQKGEVIYKKALALVPLRQDVTYALALNLAVQKKYTEAEALLKNLVKVNSPVIDNRYYLGVVQFMEGEKSYKEAFSNMEYALDKKFPASQELTNDYLRMSAYFYRTKDREDYKKIVERLVVIDEKDKYKFEGILKTLNEGNWPQVVY